MTKFDVTMSGIKGNTTEEVFQEQCYLWERGASAGAGFELFNFQEL